MSANDEMSDLIQRLQDFICTDNRVGELSEDEQYQNLISLRFLADSFKMSMTACGDTDFVGLVGELREKQREYFRTRSKDVLIECKALEKRVDDIVAKFAAEKK